MLIVGLAACGLAGCGRGGESAGNGAAADSGDSEIAPYVLAVDVFADSARSQPLRVEPPTARIWMSRIRSTTGLASVPLPAAGVDTVVALPLPPFEIDVHIAPPILKARAALFVPARLPRGERFVEIEVRVDESGAVSQVRWSGGSDDPELVGAAIDCARRMDFLPALRGGKPVAVWSTQRFEFKR